MDLKFIERTRCSHELEDLSDRVNPMVDGDGVVYAYETDRDVILRRQHAGPPALSGLPGAMAGAHVQQRLNSDVLLRRHDVIVNRSTRLAPRTHPYQRSEPRVTARAPTARSSRAARVNVPPAAVPQMQDDSEWDGWPDGSFSRLFSLEEAKELGNLKVHWACEPMGASKSAGSAQAVIWQEGKETRRKCHGVISCNRSSCNILVRPQTRAAKIRAQLERPCSCGGSLVNQRCGVISTLHTFRDGVYYQNGGTHLHQRPTHVLHLSRREEQEFGSVVENNPKASPLKLLVGRPGVDGPGESVAAISPALFNIDRIKYERRKVLKGVHGHHGQSPNFIHDFAKVDEACPGFIREAQFGSVTIIVMQTEHMAEKLVRALVAEEAVNGIVSDAAHGFWYERNDLLILSSIYEPVHLKRWMPGLISYTNGGTAEHYRIHFFHLFTSIAAECARRELGMNDDLLANVIDFSQAERKGFILAYVDFWIEHAPGQRTVDELMADAPTLLKGCAQHCKNQVARVKKISGVVDPSKRDIFENYAYKLLHCNTMDEFTPCAESFIRDFPRAESWIRWWMIPEHATMLFPSFHIMNPELWKQLPSTTNPTEAQNFKVYLALDKRMPLIPGIKGLYKFANSYRELEDAASHGVKIFYGNDPQHWKRSAARYGYTKHSRHNAPRRQVKNDGRPPDTSKALMTQKRGATERKAVYEKSYTWRKNSCWLDSALTLISTAAARDYGQSMSPMFKDVPPNSLLRDLHQMVYTRTQGSFELVGYEKGGSSLLSTQRDGFRKQIRHARGHNDPALSSFNSVFGWLYAITILSRKPGSA